MNISIDSRMVARQQAFNAMQSGLWHACLDLEFTRRSDATRLARKEHSGPLYVQKPFYPEGRDLAHVYLLHPPGGMVTGDSLRINVGMGRRSCAQLTTPGAGRVYRAREAGAVQEQINTMTLDEHSMLEWFPQECIVFDGADARLKTEVHLAPSATFSGWELVSLGLPASNSPFHSGTVKLGLRIWQEDRPVLVENLRLDETTASLLGSSAGLQGCPITGVYVAGPFREEQAMDSLMEELQALTEEYRPLDSVRSRCMTSVTRVNGFVICRYLGSCSWQARQYFVAAWSRIRPVLNQRPVCAPRIWST